ncbi:MAG: ABC transporter permease [Cyanobacteria bacterium P01_H01_bin.15]
MNLLEGLKMAGYSLSVNRLRSVLTMLGIVIGNASVITMIGVGQGAQTLAENEFESLGPNVLFVVPGSQESRRNSFDQPKTLVYEDAQAIADQVPSVMGVAPQINTTEVITYQNRNTQDLVLGITPEFLTVRSFEVKQGQFISSDDLERNARVAVLGSELAEDFFGQGNPLGARIRIKNSTFQVIGVLEEKGSFLGTNQDNVAYVPLTTMANQVVGRTSPFGVQVTFISVTARDEDSIRAAKFQIENLLRLRHKIVDIDDFDVETQKDILSIVNKVTSGLTAMLAAIAGISLLVGGIGVMNIMLVSVSERTQEIGLKKAIGASRSDILSQFLLEAAILSLLGGILGTSLGVGGVLIAGATTPLEAQISTTSIAIAVGVSGGIGLFFGVYPARQAATLDPIVALRSA